MAGVKITISRSVLRFSLLAALTLVFVRDAARADQGGVGYWLPGSFASLAATPLQRRLVRGNSVNCDILGRRAP